MIDVSGGHGGDSPEGANVTMNLTVENGLGTYINSVGAGTFTAILDRSMEPLPTVTGSLSLDF